MLKELITQLFPGHKADWRPQDGVTGVGFCPLHNDKKTRSFSVYLSASGHERWKCFAEAISGNAVDLVMKSGVAGTSTRDGANAWLINHGFSAENPAQREQRERNELYTKFMNWCRDMLLNSREASAQRSYLASRKVSLDIVAKSPIGFYPTRAEVVEWLKKNDPDNMYSSELLLARNGSDFDNSIIFGYRASDDEYTRFKLRNPQREAPGTSEKKTCFLGAKLKRNEKVGFFSTITAATDLSERVILVEGEFDVLALASLMHAGDPDSDDPFICFSGGSGMKSNINTIKGLGGPNIYIMPDNDKRGREYVFDIASEYPLVFVIAPKDFDDGADPASWCMDHSPEDFYAACEDGRSFAYTWVGKSLAAQLDAASMEEKAKLKLDFTNYAKKLPISDRASFMRIYGESLGEDLDALIEEVANSDCPYRFSRNASDYGVYYKAKVKGKQDKVEEIRISNVIIETLKTIYLDSGDGNCEVCYQVRMSTPVKTKVIDIAVSDFLDNTILKRIIGENIGASMWIKPGYLPYLVESCNMLSPTYNENSEEVVINHTGWRDDGRYYMPNCYIDADGWHELGDTRVCLPDTPLFFHKYYLLKPEGDIEQLKDNFIRYAFGVFGKEIGILILNHFLWTVTMNVYTEAKPICLWLASTTGTFKTTFISEMACLFGDFHGGANFETWRSSVNAIEREGHYVKDAPFVVDDYKPVDVNLRHVTTLIQNYGDRKGRGRMDSNTNLRPTYHVRGNLMVTAEDTPTGEASVLARTLLIRVQPPKNGAISSIRRNNLDSLSSITPRLPMVGADYISWRIRQGLDKNKCNEEIARTRAEVQDIQHGRIGETIAVQTVQWKYTRDYFHLEEYDNSFKAAINHLQVEMNTTIRDEQAGSVFIDCLSEMISSGHYYLEGRPPYASTEHDDRAQRLGWIDDKAVYIIGGDSLKAVNSYRSEGPLKYTKNAVYAQLDALGFIEKDLCDKTKGKVGNTATISISGSRKKVIPIKRGVVELEEIAPGEHGDSGILSTKTDKERTK